METIQYFCSVCGNEVDEDGYCPDHPSAIVDSIIVTKEEGVA
jgi:DNA-directed RNA polymerase subunit RPC12/RpoP